MTMASSWPSYERNSNELFSSSDKRGKFGAPKLVVVGLLQLEIELVKNDDAFWNLKKESGLIQNVGVCNIKIIFKDVAVSL